VLVARVGFVYACCAVFLLAACVVAVAIHDARPSARPAVTAKHTGPADSTGDHDTLTVNGRRYRCGRLTVKECHAAAVKAYG
jgi:hypothetical protein